MLEPSRHGLLESKLDTIIAIYKPDVIGLNEVLADKRGQACPVLRHLEKRGYQIYFAPFGPERTGQFSGSVLATRLPVSRIAFLDVGPDMCAARRGAVGHTVKVIRANVHHPGGQNINVVVSHLAHLVPYNWKAHVIHYRTLRQIVDEAELQQNTIVGGDFNQFKCMPRLSWEPRRRYNRRTGNLLHPTWRLLGKVPFIQANYDNIFWTKSGNLRLQDFRILPRYPSDHTPLMARFLVRQ